VARLFAPQQPALGAYPAYPMDLAYEVPGGGANPIGAPPRSSGQTISIAAGKLGDL
jgi:hypothetical protein